MLSNGLNLENKHIIYISIPKTATISIRESLGISSTYNHQTYDYVIKKMGEDNWNNCFKFSFVRNPFDLIVSWYFFHRDVQKIDMYINVNFKQWVLSGCPHHWVNNKYNTEPLKISRYLTDKNNNVMVDFVGKIENINKDFPRLLNQMKYKKCKLSHKNKSKHKNYRSYYDDESRKFATKLFERDLDIFKYTF